MNKIHTNEIPLNKISKKLRDRIKDICNRNNLNVNSIIFYSEDSKSNEFQMLENYKPTGYFLFRSEQQILYNEKSLK